MVHGQPREDRRRHPKARRVLTSAGSGEVTLTDQIESSPDSAGPCLSGYGPTIRIPTFCAGWLTNAKGLTLDIKAPPKGSKSFVRVKPLVRVEHAFARLGRWRRLSRCFEGTVESAQAWLEVACLAYVFTRLRAEPP